MSEERDDLIRMIQVLDATPRHDGMIEYMKKVIDLNPVLSKTEQCLLSVCYKNFIDVSRGNLRALEAYLKDNEPNSRTKCIEYLQNRQQQIADELKNYCNDLLDLVDTKLLPVANDDESKAFYIKLKADYYRYLCEALSDQEKEEASEKADQQYKEAIELANKFLKSYSPSSLGIFLNYCVYLCETAQKKDEAIALAKETYDKNYPLLDQNSEKSSDEARMILKLLEENINMWVQTQEIPEPTEQQ